MKQVTTINFAPTLPNWPAAAAAYRDGAGPYAALYALLGIDSLALGETAADQAILDGLVAQRSPGISIYDRRYTAHIYPEPDVTDGQVYEALRDYAAQHATPDPAMLEIKRRQVLDLLDQWQADGPPSAEDDAFWRDFQADLAKTKRGEYTEAAAELEQKLAEAKQDTARALTSFHEEQAARMKSLEYGYGLERQLAEADRLLEDWAADVHADPNAAVPQPVLEYLQRRKGPP